MPFKTCLGARKRTQICPCVLWGCHKALSDERVTWDGYHDERRKAERDLRSSGSK